MRIPSSSAVLAPEAASPDVVPAAPLNVLVPPGCSVAPQARALLSAAGDLRLVEQRRRGADGADGDAKRPDVVLLCVNAREPHAETAVREIASKWRPAPVLVLTESEDRAANRRLVRAGARGVVTHARQADHLVNALRRVKEGEIWLGRACMSQLLDEIVGSGQVALPPHLDTPKGLEALTERERDVVEMIARGLHNKAIAVELGITDHTVRHHLTAIFAKLGVADRLELAVYALRHGGQARPRRKP